MLLFLVGLVAGGGALALYLAVERVGAPGVPLAVLRAAAWGLVAALIADPGCRRVVAERVTVLLDASLSMTDPAGDTRWLAALDSARRIAGRGGRILLFGGPASRSLEQRSRPDQPTSLLLPALREAAATGGRLAIVTDGAIDDAAALPSDLVRAARIVIVPRPAGPDAGIAALDLPSAVRAGDTATAAVDVVVTAAAPGDSVTLELLEQGRRAALARIALGEAGTIRRELKFVPAAVTAPREVRRYEARLSGFPRDVEPRDDRRPSAALVTRAAAIAAFSDSPDWDFRWLVSTLGSTSGVPVRGFVRLGGSGWREARTMRPVAEATIRDEAAHADLVILHGSEAGTELPRRAARSGLWRNVPAGPGDSGDWYAGGPEASPVGSALAGVPPESLPPLEGVADVAADTSAWTALTARLDRRGRPRAVLRGWLSGERRTVLVSGSGLWRWAIRGGVAAEGYRALVAAASDWLLEEVGREGADVSALRDSLGRGVAEFLPRSAVLRAHAGTGLAAATEPVPLRHRTWLYFAALAAMVLEWVARRRMGLR